MKNYLTIFTKLPFLIVLLLVSISCALLIGPTQLDFNDILINGFNSNSWIILFNIRLPRIIGAIAAGSALSGAGLILQVLLNNQLASASTIGINAGAGLMIALTLLLVPNNHLVIPIASFLGAMGVSLFLVSFVKKNRFSPSTLILAGVAISSICNALLSFLKLTNDDLALNLTTFLVGSLSLVSYDLLWWPCIIIVICLIYCFKHFDTLNILQLGDSLAHHLGLKVNQQRMNLLIVAALLAASSVSFAGLLGFIGLMVPHFFRYLVGSDFKKLFPLTITGGACFLVICDLLARILFKPYELAVGIILAILGGLFFISLLLKKGERNNVGV